MNDMTMVLPSQCISGLVLLLTSLTLLCRNTHLPALSLQILHVPPLPVNRPYMLLNDSSTSSLKLISSYELVKVIQYVTIHCSVLPALVTPALSLQLAHKALEEKNHIL